VNLRWLLGRSRWTEPKPTPEPPFTPAERRAIREFDASMIPAGMYERMVGPPKRRRSLFDKPARKGSGLDYQPTKERTT
jgi:hypothetical protein